MVAGLKVMYALTTDLPNNLMECEAYLGLGEVRIFV